MDGVSQTDEPTEASATLHDDRERARSFGAIASDYDRYRTSYPDGLIADLVELGPDRVLDVACGTGKVAVPLIACGLAVLGVEPDEKMAAVARSHGVFVEVSPFESWDDDGRRFGLITCGQGWHWIDPVAGVRKAAGLLEPGGTLALFWTRPDLSPELEAGLDAVYAEQAPQLNKKRDDGDSAATLRANGFAEVETRTYRWTRTFTADEWAYRASTFSDHQLLPAEQRERLLTGLHDFVESRGGSIDVGFGTYTILARTPETDG